MMNLVLALLRLLNPIKGKVVIHLGCGLLMVQPSSLNASGYYRSSCYSYPTYREKIVEKVVLNTVYQVQPLFALQYTPVSYASSYAVNVAEQKAVYYPQPYAVPVQPVYAQPVYAPLAVQKQSHATCEDKVAGLMQSNAGLLARIEKLESGIPERMAVTVGGGFRKCAACHDSNDNAAKGKGHTYFDNGVARKWDAETREEMMYQVTAGLMPKGSKLSDSELSELVSSLRAMKKANGTAQLKAPPPQPDKPALVDKPARKEPPP